MKTAEEFRASAAAHEQEAFDSFERCDTDGFVTQWAHGVCAQRDRIAASIAEAGGVAEFAALFDLDGNWVPSKLIDAKYGTCWALLDEHGKFTGDFISAFPKRASTMAKKGFYEGHALWPAKARIVGTGHGLSGSAWAVAAKIGADIDPPVAIVDNGQEA